MRIKEIFIILFLFLKQVCFSQEERVFEVVSKKRLDKFKGFLESGGTLYKYTLTLRSDSTFNFLACMKIARNLEFAFPATFEGKYCIVRKKIFLTITRTSSASFIGNRNLELLLYQKRMVITKGKDLNRLRLRERKN